MREIQLTQGYVALVSDKDYQRVSKFKWTVQKQKNTNYARRSVWIAKYKQGAELLHRFILGITDRSVEVDHKDHDGLNCQRRNLRAGTKADNQHNSKLRSDNTSGHKGVTWFKKARKWHSKIQIHGKRKHLGSFDDVKEAARAYDKAAKELFGRFANPNFAEVA